MNLLQQLLQQAQAQTQANRYAFLRKTADRKLTQQLLKR
jgi:hypothetical protein